ncbi:MAG: hypothetical protein AAFR26_06955 [Cyanobacteria bacterium J06626_4]
MKRHDGCLVAASTNAIRQVMMKSLWLKFLTYPMNSEQSDRPDLSGLSDDESNISESTVPARPEPLSDPAVSRQLFGSWLRANTLGFAIAGTVLFLIGLLVSLSAVFAAGFFVGAIVGPLQAIVLRRQISKLKVWQWSLACILGGYLGTFFGLIAMLYVVGMDWPIPFIDWASIGVFGAFIGICVGWGQVLVIDRYVRGLRRWWAANVLGRSLGWLSAQFLWLLLTLQWTTLSPLNSPNSLPIVVLCGAVGGLVYGAVTARALPYLVPAPAAIVDHSAITDHPA